MPIDWSTAATPDMFSAYLDAYDRGRELARQRRTEGAKKLFTAAGDGGEKEMGAAERPGQPAGLPHLPFQEIVKRLGPEVRLGAKHRAGVVSGLAQALSQYPYSERHGLLRHVAPNLKSLGFHQSDIGAFDPSDANLAEAHQTATQMHQHLSDADDVADTC